MYILHEKLIVNTTLEKAWSFISRPANLNEITPDDMDFNIMSDLPDEMYNGLIIRYKIKIPFLGTQEWVSEIKHISPNRSFVDEQRKGPYKFWFHYHEVREVEGGVELTDTIHYDIPFWIFGKIAHVLFVRRMLQNIFNHRKMKFGELLNKKTELEG